MDGASYGALDPSVRHEALTEGDDATSYRSGEATPGAGGGGGVGGRRVGLVVRGLVTAGVLCAGAVAGSQALSWSRQSSSGPPPTATGTALAGLVAHSKPQAVHDQGVYEPSAWAESSLEAPADGGDPPLIGDDVEAGDVAGGDVAGGVVAGGDPAAAGSDESDDEDKDILALTAPTVTPTLSTGFGELWDVAASAATRNLPPGRC